MIPALADAMLVLSLLFVQPAPDRAWPVRLLLHAGLLAACLALAALVLPAPVTGRCLVGLLAAAVATILYALAGEGWSRTPAPGRAGLRLAGGLLLAGLAIRLGRRAALQATLPAPAAGILAASLGMLLVGLLGALAGRGARARTGSLLLAADGLLLAACLLPGLGIAAPASLLPIEAGLLAVLLRRPDDAAAEPPRWPGR